MPARQIYIEQGDGHHVSLNISDDELEELKARGATVRSTRYGLRVEL